MLEGLLARAQDPAKLAGYEAQLLCPPFPRSLNYLWRAFYRLRRRKGSNGFAMMPIEWPDIDAFCRNARFPLAEWEVELIEMLDDLFLVSQQSAESDLE